MKALAPLVTAMALVFSCSQPEKPSAPIETGPKVVKAKGYVVPKDSVESPKMLPAGEPSKVVAINPKVVYTQSNVHAAKKPRIVPVGTPKVSIPGRNGVLLPQPVPAIFSSKVPAIPHVTAAKELYSKDHNPHNFSSFSKLQGLKSNLVSSIMEDSQGNIWFGTLYGGVSKYDGKNFSHFSRNEGLLNISIRAMIEDENGDVWLGTDGGLTKYDGKYFSHLTINGDLGDVAVFSLLRDKKGDLWIGTLGGGVGKFDGKSITKYSERDGLSNTILSMLEDAMGNLWFGTYRNGVIKFDGNSFVHFTENEGMTGNVIYDIHEDKNSHIWFATDKGITKYDGNSFFHFTENEGLSNNMVKKILEIENDQLWFCTAGGGVISYDGKSFTHFTEKEGLSINFVETGLEDRSGNLWFGTNGGGVSKYISGFTQFTDKTGLSNKFVSSIYEDQKGNLWIGTFSGGVNKFDGEKFVHFTVKEGLGDVKILSLLEDKKGNLWFGMRGGVSRYDGTTFFSYTEKEGLGSNWIWTMLEDIMGNLWFGVAYEGVIKFDGQIFSHYGKNQGLSNSTVTSLLEDQKRNLWIGTEEGELIKFDGENFTHFTNRESLGNDPIREMVEDRYGNLWVGTQGSGLIKLAFTPDSDTVTFTHFTEKEGLSNNDVMAMFKSKNGDLWIGTALGLNLLKEEKISLLNQEISISRNLFKTYTYEDGFSGVGLNHGKTIFEASDGVVWLGADDELIAFNPQEQKRDKNPANIHLSGIALFTENIAWQTLAEQQSSGKDTTFLLGNGIAVHDFRFDGLSRWYGVPENLSLRYDNNHITFQFVSINAHSPKKIRYQYQLVGIDPQWSAITEHGQAYYGNLPHGKYTFEVKALNGEGLWSNVLHYPFEIRPPWWLTWWAKALYVMMGIALVVGLKKYTENRERIKHELKIQKLETEKMHEVDQLKSRFFANISHEFRTPLTLILGPLEKLVAQASTENGDKPVFQMMQRNAQRLLDLINQLLDLSKIETGSMKLEPKPANLVSFLKSLILSFAPLAERQHIKYKFQYPSGEPVAYFDDDKLEKIITNLLSNAFKFTPSGGTVRVSAVLKDAEKESIPADGHKKGAVSRIQTLELKIKDSGVGIAPDQMDRIFGRFYQIDTSQTREKEGTGIGLSLVKELVELHQGEVFVESQLNQGSCFTVRLPLPMAGFEEVLVSGPALSNNGNGIGTPDPPENEGGGLPEPAMKGADSEAALVLIIEDNPDVRLFIREHLQPLYQMIEAADGEQGYRLAIETVPDLILSDVMMPKMDGVELSRKLKTNEKTAHVPVILLTARASGGDKIEGLETGADDYLIKPFDASELLVRMKNLIDSRKKLREHFSREIILQPTGVAITSLDEKFLQQAMKTIEEHISDPAFGIDVFCEEVGMSRTQLFRKFKALTNYAPGDFIRLIRLKRAAELLTHGAGTIAEVAFMVGFQDPSYFTKSFQRQFGKTPSEFIAIEAAKTNQL